jgi:4-hydroxy-tetrahydrodipicolinate synthase
MKVAGVWLPIVTPFFNDEIDFESYKKILDFYISKGINGLVPLGTTGEVSTIDDCEYEKLVAITVEYVNNRVPLLIGAGGNYTKKVIKQIKLLEKYGVQGILSVSPYYNRPDQNGIFEHFKCIAESTELDIVIYNIPYRTGRNIENETIYRLAELQNITGIKDSCGDFKQTMELILNKPEGFSVLTGEDIQYYSTLALGGDGGILAAAHLQTEDYLNIYKLISENDHKSALRIWDGLTSIIPLLFIEPNPAPVKFLLNSMGLIKSFETRLPITSISKNLEEKLIRVIPS